MTIDKKRIKELFALHPNAESLSITQDGTIFFTENDARGYSSQQKFTEHVITILRSEAIQWTGADVEVRQGEAPVEVSSPAHPVINDETGKQEDAAGIIPPGEITPNPGVDPVVIPPAQPETKIPPVKEKNTKSPKSGKK